MPEELLKEFNFEVTSEITCKTKAGDQTQVEVIVLLAPSTKNTNECAALKQAFFQASKEHRDSGAKTDRETKGDKEETIDGDDILKMIAMSSVDYPQVLATARKLLTTGGVALVEGETKLTSHQLDQMSDEEFEQMVGDYLANFILASSIAKMLKD